MKTLVLGRHARLFAECGRLSALIKSSSNQEVKRQEQENLANRYFELYSSLVRDNDVPLLEYASKNVAAVGVIKSLLSQHAQSLFYYAFSSQPASLEAAKWLYHRELFVSGQPHPVVEAAQYGVVDFMAYCFVPPTSAAHPLSLSIAPLQFVNARAGENNLLHVLCRRSSSDTLRCLTADDELNYAALALRAGCDINAPGSAGRPLQCALEAGKTHMVEWLLENDAIFDFICKDNHSNMYHYVRDTGSFLIVQQAADARAIDINQINLRGKTPLLTILAENQMAESRRAALVALFCEFGANPDIEDGITHKNAMESAERLKNKGKLCFLMQAHPAYLVLMRQISDLPPLLRQNKMILALLNNRPNSNRERFDPIYPMDYQPMPSIKREDVNIDLICHAIKHQYHILLKALLLLHCEERELHEAPSRRVAVVLSGHWDSVMFYTAMRENTTRASGAIALWLKKIYYSAGFSLDDYLDLISCAATDNNEELCELYVESAENLNGAGAKLNADVISYALVAGHAALADKMHGWGYRYTPRHVSIAANSPDISSSQLYNIIQKLAPGKSKPLRGVEIAKQSSGMIEQKKAMLIDAGAKVNEPVQVQGVPRQSYGAIDMMPGRQRRSSPSTSTHGGEGIPLLATFKR